MSQWLVVPGCFRVVVEKRPEGDELVLSAGQAVALTVRKAIEHKTLVAENRRLLELTTRQVRELDRMSHDLRIVTRIASQDLREPLATIADRSEQIESALGAGRADTAPDHIARIRDAVGRAERLVEELAARAGAEPLA